MKIKSHPMAFFRNTFFTLLLILLGVSVTAHAQFEGSFRVNVLDITNNGSSEKVINRFTVSSTPERIVLSDIGRIKTLEALTGMRVNSVLIRNDQEDFAFVGDAQAVTLGKQQLLALNNMMKSMQQQGGQTIEPNNPEFAMRRTSDVRDINGYQTVKWVAETDDAAVYYDVWITDEINMNWGMLAEPWLMDFGLFQGFPDQNWMNENNFPLLVERYDNYKLSEVVRVDNIRSGEVDNAEISIPSGMQTITFQQLLMNRMSQQ